MEFQGPGFPRAYGRETNTANREPLNKRALKASCKPGAAPEPKARRSRQAPGAGVGGPPSGRKVGRRRRAGVSGARGEAPAPGETWMCELRPEIHKHRLRAPQIQGSL